MFHRNISVTDEMMETKGFFILNHEDWNGSSTSKNRLQLSSG